MADKGKGIADDYPSGKRKRDGDDKSGHRKRKNLSVLQFFEDSAFEIEESGSSDDEDFINDVFVEDEFDAATDVQVKTEPKTPNIPFFPKEEEMDEEELEKILEARYKPGSNFVKYSEDRTEAARLDERNTFMPYVKDPTIWKVKCTVGRERHSAFCLMQKYVDLQSLGTKLQIISAFAVEHVKGFIYIEAEKQCDINEACKGLCNIYPSRVAPVPATEVSHLFSVRSKYSGVSVDTWARVKNGKYKGDLAQVVNVNEAQRKATVKLVPRIDLQAVAEKFGGGITGKKSAIPAPRLITSSELEAYRPLIQYRRDRDTGDMYEVFDGMTLKDGYLFKKVALDSLSFWDVRPSEAELIKFAPSKKEESNDVEWLTGLFGERKKKKQTINNDKVGGKGEGSSSSSMEYSFEVHDLVFHGRKAFGVVIGREKDDRIKVLEEGSERPVVVAVEARLLKKADFDKKFTALDQHKKIISTNDTVRVLEGPLEDKQGIVKQIYKGVVFLHDENEQENCGYFCAKAQICEKMEFSADLFKGKGGKSDASGFDDFSSSPKSPLSPKKPWEGRENNRSYNREDKDGFSVGQSLRIRVGPLKGYMCRVMAIRYSDITVKLDSQHKILTVKSEHLAEVREKSSGVSMGDGQDSAKPFELLGDHESSQGWMDGGVASESGGWNAGGPSTERSSWAPFPAADSLLRPESSSANPFNSVDNDASKDVGASAWETKTTQNQSSAWGAAASEKKPMTDTEHAGGWGTALSVAKTGNSDDAGWGSAKLKLGGPVDASNDTTSWGKNNSWGKDKDGGSNQSSTWGKAESLGNVKGPEADSWGNAASKLSSNDGENKSAWNSAAPATQSGGWGNLGGSSALPDSGAGGWNQNANVSGGRTDKWGGMKNDGDTKGWGKPDTSNDDGSSWNKQSGGSSWGNQADQGQSDGWNKAQSSAGGWGNNRASDGGNKDDDGAGGWSKTASVALGESGKWGNADKKAEGATGGGSKKEGESSWSKSAGGSSWNNQDGGGSSWSKQDGGSSSWGKAEGGGGSSWSNQDGGSAWSKQDGGRSGGGDRYGGRGGNNGGIQGRGSGGNTCFKCGETGHMARECPQGGSSGGNACFKCGETGHMARDCSKGGGGGGNACFKCGETGHMSRDCSQGGGSGSGGGNACFKCGETGHMARDCSQGGGGSRNACFKCGESGHMARDCSQGGGGGGGGGSSSSGKTCFKCGETGHMSRECPKGGGGRGNACFKCGETGHMARDCSQGGGSGGGSRTCYKCGESGHMARDCSQGGGGRGGGRGGSYGGGRDGGGGSGRGTGGWGSVKASDTGKKDNAEGSGWGSGDQTGGWGSKKDDAQSSGWSSGNQTGGWGSTKASNAVKKDDAQGNGWGSNNQTGEWGSSKSSDAGKKADAQGSQWGSGDKTGVWGSSRASFDGGKKADAKGSGWGGGGDQAGGWGSSNASDTAAKKDGRGNGGQTGGWGSSKDSDAGDKKDDAEGSGWKKGGNW